jgi:hypothetical protein
MYKIALFTLLPLMTICSQKQDDEIIRVIRVTQEMVPALLASLKEKSPSSMKSKRLYIKDGASSDEFIVDIISSSDSLDEKN